MKIWGLLINASNTIQDPDVSMGWTAGLPNPLFCSLLESATKPIDKDEEESYRAAFAGEQKGFAGKLICSPSVWLEPQWSDLAGLPSGGKRDLVIWNSHIGADIIGSTHSNQKTLNWTKRLIEPSIHPNIMMRNLDQLVDNIHPWNQAAMRRAGTNPTDVEVSDIVNRSGFLLKWSWWS